MEERLEEVYAVQDVPSDKYKSFLLDRVCTAKPATVYAKDGRPLDLLICTGLRISDSGLV